LSDRLYRALTDPQSTDVQALALAYRKERLDPLQALLGARGDLPPPRRLVVVPTGELAFVPVGALGAGYSVSYVPSGSLLARTAGRPRRLRGAPLLALGDPIFAPPPPPAPPRSGVLLRAVLPGGNAARAGLQAGDVLLSIGQQELASPRDLSAL